MDLACARQSTWRAATTVARGAITPIPGIRRVGKSAPSQGGEERTLDELMAVIAYNEAPVPLSGGDPLLQPDGTRALIHRIKQELGYNVWCYTGYTWEKVVTNPKLLEVVQELDVLVDGPFVQAERDISLRFRGSRNQRLIDVQRTLASSGPTSPITIQ